jgi:aspartyl-tRNA(Asn)/glutamyl-tRNA(Gln) amidotransferase subunit A
VTAADAPHRVTSTARAAFVEARAYLARRGLDRAREPLPLQIVPHAAGSVPADPMLGAATPRGDLKGRGPIHAAIEAQRCGQLTSRAVVEASLAAIEARDEVLMAVVAMDPAGALDEADRCDAERASGRPSGRLHGIPLTVKDVIDVAGLPTRAGSDAYDDLPTTDAIGVARLRRAGAVILAKTSTHEFALGVTSPQSRNPHDPTRIPGGSSGGSAIAVATGMGLGSLGTDTRASIRVPAALSGTVGFKPTFGRIPTDGLVTLSWTMDHLAPMAATVADAALLLEVLLDAPGGELVDAVGQPMTGLRIGLPEAAWNGSEPAVADAVDRCVAHLERLGATLEPAAGLTARHLDDANAAGLIISRCEAAAFHRGLGTDYSRCWPEVAEQLEEASRESAADYLDAQRVRGELMDDLGALFGEHDLLAMPTVPVVAPRVDDFARYLMVLARTAIPWSLVGFPAISVPCGTDASGLPIGIQLVARPYAERVLVAAGTAVETLPTRGPDSRA